MKLELKSYVTVHRQFDDVLVMAIKVLLIIWGSFLIASETWKLILPRPVAPMPQLETPKNDLRETILASHWFGNSASPSVIATSVVNFKLIGVFSPTAKKTGFAILKMADGKQRVAILNEEILPGIKLQALGANYIEVGQVGNLQKIPLEHKMLLQTPSISIVPKVP